MGNIKYGPLADEVSGTIGGVTFFRGRHSKCARTWRAPSNKQRPDQLTRRRILATVSNAWRTDLDNAMRTSWDTYALTCPFTNALGETYYLTGFEMFCRNNATWWPWNAGWLQTMPPYSGFPPEKTPTFSLVQATGVLSITALAPSYVLGDRLDFTVHTLRPITQTFPRRAPVNYKSITQLSDALPQTLYTFPDVPSAAGDYQALVTWYYTDINMRLSTQRANLVISA